MKTLEEASEKIRDCIALDGYELSLTKDFKDSLFIALEALEKATPEFVNYVSDGEADGYPVYDFAYCPNCDHLFEDGDQIWESNYCPYCGKALKWWEDIENDDA